jgi:hypothetical protein
VVVDELISASLQQIVEARRSLIGQLPTTPPNAQITNALQSTFSLNTPTSFNFQ